MSFNEELARKTLAFITEHPDQWEQGDYYRRIDSATIGKPVGCFALHAALLSGGQLTEHSEGLVPTDAVRDAGAYIYGERAGGTPSVAVDDYAVAVLGEHASRRLFHGHLELADLEERIAELAEEYPAEVEQDTTTS